MPILVIALEKTGSLLFLTVSLLITVTFRYFVFNFLSDSSIAVTSIYIGQLPGVITMFSLGLVAAFLQHENKLNISVKSVFIALILSFIWSEILLNNLEDYWQGNILLFIWESINSLLLILVILGVYKSRNRFLCTPIFLWFGKISYGIYLWHLPVILYFKNQQLSFEHLLLIVFPITVLLASISYYLIENRFSKPR